MEQLPILYSFRRCPYAIRTRMVLYACQTKCELREVVLKDKPKEMVSISPKATVPVLLLPTNKVIDESHDIIKWAVNQNDPNQWEKYLTEMDALIEINDHQFKTHLDKYKYSSRHKELTKEEHRSNANFFLSHLEQLLEQNKFLSSNDQTITDLSVFPFVRQFAFVDKQYFDDLPYPKLKAWLEWNITSPVFKNVMQKYPQWKPEQEKIIFP